MELQKIVVMTLFCVIPFAGLLWSTLSQGSISLQSKHSYAEGEVLSAHEFEELEAVKKKIIDAHTELSIYYYRMGKLEKSELHFEEALLIEESLKQMKRKLLVRSN